MTLIIGGYFYEKNIRFDYDGKSKEPLRDVKVSEGIWNKRPSGIFMVADSTISSVGHNNKTLLSGFKKIYPIQVNLWKPYFIGNNFKDYKSVHQSLEVILGFAGGTLSAQHCINTISHHLSRLRISCLRDVYPIKYTVLMDCEDNPLRDSDVEWMEDTFVDSSDYEYLLEADYLATVIQHSIEIALRSARNYKLSKEDFDSLMVDFMLGVWCPKDKMPKLYDFTVSLKCDLEDQKYQVHVSQKKIPYDSFDISVLGMASRFEAPAKAAYLNALQKGECVEREMHSFLDMEINNMRKEGLRSIDYPSVLKVLDERGISLKKVNREAV
jgi:hypothetical protein